MKSALCVTVPLTCWGRHPGCLLGSPCKALAEPREHSWGPAGGESPPRSTPRQGLLGKGFRNTQAQPTQGPLRAQPVGPEFNLSWCHCVAWPHPGGVLPEPQGLTGHAAPCTMPRQGQLSGVPWASAVAQGRSRTAMPRGRLPHAAPWELGTCQGPTRLGAGPLGPARASEPPGGRDRPPARLPETSQLPLGVFRQDAPRQQWVKRPHTAQPAPRGVTCGTVPHVRAGAEAV